MHATPGSAHRIVFFLAIVSLFATIAVFGYAGYLEMNTEGGISEQSTEAVMIGLAIFGCLGMMIVGLVIGLVALFQKGKRRTFAAIGVGLNGFFVFVVVAAIWFGITPPDSIRNSQGMTHFEYIAVAISIILGLGVIQILSSLRQIVDNHRRYWLHTLWVFIVFWVIVQNWWAFWGLRDVEWNFAYFALWISYVSALFLFASSLTSPVRPDVDWETHYFERHRWVFGLFLVVAVMAVFLTWYLLDMSLVHPYRLFQLALMSIAVWLCISKHKQTHEVLGVVFLVVLFAGQLWFRFSPDLAGGTG